MENLGYMSTIKQIMSFIKVLKGGLPPYMPPTLQPLHMHSRLEAHNVHPKIGQGASTPTSVSCELDTDAASAANSGKIGVSISVAAGDNWSEDIS